MDIDSDTLGIPDTDYDARVTMPSHEFTRIVRDLSQLGESVRIEVSKEGVRFASEGEAANGSVLLKGTDGTESSNGKLKVKTEEGADKDEEVEEVEDEEDEDDDEEKKDKKKIKKEKVKKEKAEGEDVEMVDDDDGEFKAEDEDGEEEQDEGDESDNKKRKRGSQVRSMFPTTLTSN